MTLHLGYVPASSTIYIPFHTFDSNGASITLTGLAVTDIEIYKNGSVAQRSSDAGYTLLDTDGIDFDGITGLHGISIDLSDNTDAGFYAAGNFYMVGISSVTVDTRTVNFWAATFFIGPAAANVTELLGTAWLTPGTAGTPDVNTKLAGGTVWASGAITAPSIASDAITASKIANGAIDAATFAADVDAEILSYLVDDATRIDASALNTASTATGSNGSGLTEAGGTGDQFTAVPWNAAWDAEVQSEVDDSLNTVVADSVAADGSRPTVRQALLMITRFLMERSITTTTMTVYKEDGTTAVMTFTLNDATTPTALTRAT